MNRRWLSVWVLMAGLLLAAGPAAATAVANFDDGNSATEVDGYPGVAGGGWANAWVQPTEGGATWSAGPTVASATPLQTGGGNYLTATMDSAALSRKT